MKPKFIIALIIIPALLIMMVLIIGSIYTYKIINYKNDVYLVYEIDLSHISIANKDNVIQTTEKIFKKRLQAIGIIRPDIKSSTEASRNIITIGIPSSKNNQSTISLIGKTAQLEFKEFKDGAWVSTGVTGKQFSKADVQFDSEGKPEISIEFNDEGTKLFADVTQRNLQKQVAISLDDQIISAPTVQSVITEGRGVITGEFNVASAKELMIQLNAGALPAPVKLIEIRQSKEGDNK